MLGFDSSIFIDLQAVSRRNLTRVSQKCVTLLTVTGRTGVEEVGVFAFQVFADSLRFKVVNVHPFAHITPNLAVETINAPERKLITQSRTITLIIFPSAGSVTTDMWRGGINIRFWNHTPRHKSLLRKSIS